MELSTSTESDKSGDSYTNPEEAAIPQFAAKRTRKYPMTTASANEDDNDSM